MFGSGNATSVILNEEMEDIMKIVTSLEEFGLLIKGISETIKNKIKKTKRRILGASLLGSLLAGKDAFRAGEDTVRVGQDI